MNLPSRLCAVGKLLMLAGVFFPAVLMSSVAQADANGLETRSGHSLGLSLGGYRYKEPGFMTLTARKIGVDYSGTYAFGTPWPRTSESWFVRGDLRYATGKADYRSPESGSLDNAPDWYAEVLGVIGRDVDMGRHVLSPYAGLGWRYLLNDLRVSPAGYRRISEYTFLPLGLTLKIRLEDQSRIDLSLEYRHLIRGLQQARLSESNAGLPDLRLRQKKGYGLKLELLRHNGPWSWGPHLVYWHIDPSEIGGQPAYFEPENKTLEIGIKTKYRF